jgi:5-methylcytosine-specific restriction endonuclease McrA
MSERVPATLRDLVQARAGFRCEYCLFHEDDTWFPHEVDHIVARKHRGETRADNLAWACFACNGFKGSDLTSIDPETGRVVRLFNPRKDKWARHFRLEGPLILPLTAKGRVTEYLLQLNQPRFVRARQILLLAGRYPR